MSGAAPTSSKVAVAAAAVGGLSVACYLVAKAARKNVQKSLRKQAASPFEYHIAVCGPIGAAAAGDWLLVKVPKSGDLKGLRAAVATALQLEAGCADGLQLLPVLRGARGQGTLGEALAAEGSLAPLERILAQRPPEQLQVLELVCVPPGSMPPMPPAAPPAFPTPGLSLPLLGHTYLLLGSEEVYTYNVTNWIFPPNAPQYPYGATVRSYSGGVKSKIEDFPESTVFHPDAETYTTWSADATFAEELLARAGEFPKLWNRPAQKALQDFTGNGLFTSSETSEDWQSAHSVLPRGFNQIKVKSFTPQILAKTRAFIREWSAFPAGHKITDVNHWLTAMTADAVVTCSMGLDMGNVERMGQGLPSHPFVDNFRFGLGFTGFSITAKSEYGLKRFIPFFGAQARLKARYEKAKKALNDLVDEMVEQTRAGELGGRHSIIRAMLQDKAASGKQVRFGALYGQIINLMIAGHETTAATLGFTIQLLAENPDCEARALDEVRTVLQGRTEPTADDVPKLQYVEQCFREALRLYSPVAMLSRDVAHDTLIRGHRVFQGERVNVMTRALHTNPEYWGGEFGDPYSYNPDRFAPEAVKRRHPNAYHPWGFGPRACIGSQFALFEAKTFLASLLLHFKVEAVPGYRLKASLEAGGAAPSPHKLEFIIYPRPGGPLYGPGGAMVRMPPAAPVLVAEPTTPAAAKQDNEGAAAPDGKQGPLMQILFGSNAGASQEFAAQVAGAARRSGFKASTSSLDQGAKDGALEPDGRLVVVVTSTYNGNPPDNATGFQAWLAGVKDDALAGLRFAVFGVGNSQWQTYQQFPREVDAALERCGAQRVHTLGACDVDSASFDSDFDEWLAGFLRAVGGAADAMDATDPAEEEAAQEFVAEEPGAPGSTALLADIEAALATLEKDKEAAAKKVGVKWSENALRGLEVAEASRELCQKPETGRSVRHVTLRLPATAAKYRAGDHLEVLPCNDPNLVAVALEAVGLAPDAPIRWDPTKGSKSSRNARDGDEALRPQMPIRRVTAKLVLEWIPDLALVPSRKALARLARSATGQESRAWLQALAADAAKHKEELAGPQVCLAEVLKRCSGQLALTLGELCALAKPLGSRYYSVSSSPAGAADPRLVTVSVGQVEYRTGTGRLHRGLASTLLGRLAPGHKLPGCVRQLTGGFHLPEDPLAPVIMVGPGTGVAPMMGFLQERAHLLKQGKKLGPAVLFFGCRRSDEDYLYREELAGHLQSGALSELHTAFSRAGLQKVYVQDVIFEQRAQVWKLLQRPNATIYVCGDARAMAPDVRKAFKRVAEDCGGKSEAKADSMVAAMVESGRYLEDVWAA